MTSLQLFIDIGVTETRFFWTVDEAIAGFWFAPRRSQSSDAPPPSVGDIFVGRIRHVARDIEGAFVDIGLGRDGFISARRAQGKLVEGALLPVRIRRPAVRHKGAELDGDWRGGLSQREISIVKEWLATPPDAFARAPLWRDAALDMFRFFDSGRIQRITVNDVSAHNAVKEYLGDEWHGHLRLAKEILWTDEIEAELDAALERTIDIPGGGRLIFDHTEAGVMIDIDAGSAADGGSGRLNDRVNAAAAKLLALEIERRAVSGLIVIDFLPPSGAKARQSLLRELGFVGRQGRLEKDGVFTVRRRFVRPCLLDMANPVINADSRLKETSGDDAGSIAWTARAAMRGLELRLARQRSTHFRMIVPPTMESYFADKQELVDQLKARFGARFEIVGSDHADRSGRNGYDIVENA